MQIIEPIVIELLEPQKSPKALRRNRNNIESKYKLQWERVLGIGITKLESTLERVFNVYDKSILGRNTLISLYRVLQAQRSGSFTRLTQFTGVIMILLQSLYIAAERITLDLLVTTRCIPPKLYKIDLLNKDIQLNIIK